MLSFNISSCIWVISSWQVFNKCFINRVGMPHSRAMLKIIRIDSLYYMWIYKMLISGHLKKLDTSDICGYLWLKVLLSLSSYLHQSNLLHQHFTSSVISPYCSPLPEGIKYKNIKNIKYIYIYRKGHLSLYIYIHREEQ